MGTIRTKITATGRDRRLGVLAGGLILLTLTAATGGLAASTEVRGGYVNTLDCVPQSYTPHTDDPTTFDVTCDFGSLWTGALEGHTLGRFTATMDVVSGDISGFADEWFYGTYTDEPGSFGGIHISAPFFIDGSTSTLREQAAIIEGTCSFAGSSGMFTFNGTSVFGGFVAQWTRPEPAPPPAPTCNPVTPAPVSMP